MNIRKLLVALLATTMVLGGCAKEEETKEEPKETVTEENTLSYDVVVIGAGGAGLTAALEAFDQGASVVVLEKMSIAGGNTNRASGGMNASETSVEKENGIEDSNDLFYEDTMKGGYNKNNPELVRNLVEKSAETIDWLKTIGVNLTGLSTSGGQSAKRTHTPEDGSAVGGYLVEHLVENLDKRGIEISYNTRATQILMDENGAACGVVAERDGKTYTYDAKAVVLAAGGFGANEEMWTKYRPELKGYVTTNHAGATGDGIVMAQAIGANLVDIEQIQIHPTVEQTTSELISESVRGSGAILLNQQGNRFTNEMLTRDVVSANENALPEGYAYVFFDNNLRTHKKAIDKYDNKGLITSADTLDELASKLGMDGENLKATIADYNAVVRGEKADDLGRTTGLEMEFVEAPYHAIKVAPGIHHTMGGVEINVNAEVINTEGKTITALYAAGEVTGGVHGANRLGGNAVADIVIYGRTAGMNAGKYALANGGVGHGEVVAKSEEAVTFEIKEGLEPKFKDGTYTATATGNNGDVVVTAVVEGGYIVSITTVNEETPMIFKPVQETLIPAIVYNQSAEVDSVAGSSMSSRAVKTAMEQIIAEASK